MTADEIRHGIEELARDGDGADRRWALKQLKADTADEVVLERPATEKEIIQRLGRLMRGAGMVNTKAAYAIAFSHDRRITVSKGTTVPSDLDVNEETLPKTLKMFYRLYPDRKKHGFPVGFPVGKGPVAIMKWCQQEALEIEKEKLKARTAAVAADITNTLDLPTDGADGKEAALAEPLHTD